MHAGMIALLLWLVDLFQLGTLATTGVGAVAALLLYEHSIVSPGDLRRMNAAFFTLNGLISVLFFAFVAADVLLHK
jgi:4-hydroxybenzoate polyprenyltransferase